MNAGTCERGDEDWVGTEESFLGFVVFGGDEEKIGRAHV